MNKERKNVQCTPHSKFWHERPTKQHNCLFVCFFLSLSFFLWCIAVILASWPLGVLHGHTTTRLQPLWVGRFASCIALCLVGFPYPVPCVYCLACLLVLCSPAFSALWPCLRQRQALSLLSAFAALAEPVFSEA